MIALRGKNGVVTAVDKLITSKLYVEVGLLYILYNIGICLECKPKDVQW